MKCPRCGSDTRMQVQATISAPGNLAHKFSKQNLRRKDVFLMGVNWETADFICTNQKCNTVTLGYGNYVSKLERLLKAISCTDYDGIQCNDIDGKNWFDIRDEILNN